MDSVVVSVRISKQVKSRLEHEGIDITEAVRDFLMRKAAQIELKKAIDRISQSIERNVKPSKKGFAVKSVREDRDVGH